MGEFYNSEELAEYFSETDRKIERQQELDDLRSKKSVTITKSERAYVICTSGRSSGKRVFFKTNVSILVVFGLNTPKTHEHSLI